MKETAYRRRCMNGTEADQQDSAADIADRNGLLRCSGAVHKPRDDVVL
jgi:hypothetical protein